MIIRLVLSQIASECVDVENSVCMRPRVRLRLISNQESISKGRDSLIEQSNTLIEQLSHATEKMTTISPVRYYVLGMMIQMQVTYYTEHLLSFEYQLLQLRRSFRNDA